jgi:AcrR family transcriptional regulator
VSSSRLPAAERRAAVLECACEAFSRGSYRGTTTAEIAQEAGVTEPILYRHFTSKRELYLACLTESWARVRTMWERAIADEPDPAMWVSAMGRSFMAAGKERVVISNLWVQSIAESSEDAEIREFMRAHMHEVHGFVVAVIRRAQAEGGIFPERDASAEAWLFLSIGLLRMVSDGLGGLLDDDFPRIAASRREWLTGRTEF